MTGGDRAAHDLVNTLVLGVEFRVATQEAIIVFTADDASGRSEPVVGFRKDLGDPGEFEFLNQVFHIQNDFVKIDPIPALFERGGNIHDSGSLQAEVILNRKEMVADFGVGEESMSLVNLSLFQ